MGPAADVGSSIYLAFDHFDTECNYDYVHVYDGTGYDSSNLLASLSGNTLPEPIHITTGKMTVRLASDKDYSRSGFSASIMVDDPGGATAGCDSKTTCSGHGVCGADGKCKCFSQWKSTNCDKPKKGLNFNNRPPDRWKSETKVGPPRAGHTATLVNGKLWVLGGFDLNAILSDTQVVDVPCNQPSIETCWTSAALGGDAHVPRYWHSAVANGGDIYVFGGVTANPSGNAGLPGAWRPTDLVDLLQVLDTNKETWGNVLPLLPTGDAPPPLALHTATAVGSGDAAEMLVIGGNTGNPGYLEDVYSFNFRNQQWSKLKTTGGNPQVAGHTSVYNAASGAVYVFGGYELKWPGYSDRTNTLRMFNVAERQWALREPLTDSKIPSLALHTAVVIGSHMVVYGGSKHTHIHDEECYAEGVLAYSFDCDVWVPYSEALAAPKTMRGRFSHTATTLADGSMMVVGGFSGMPRGETALYVPESWCTVTDKTHLRSSCVHHVGCTYCQSTNSAFSYLDKCTDELKVPACEKATAGNKSIEQLPVPVVCDGRCSRFYSCGDCTADNGCVWCPGTSFCSSIDSGSSPGAASCPVSAVGAPSTPIAKFSECAAAQPPVGFFATYWTSKYDYFRKQQPRTRIYGEARVELESVEFIFMSLEARIRITEPGVYRFRVVTVDAAIVTITSDQEEDSESYFEQVKLATRLGNKESLNSTGVQLSAGQIAAVAAEWEVINDNNPWSATLEIYWQRTSAVETDGVIVTQVDDWEIIPGTSTMQFDSHSRSMCSSYDDCGSCRGNPGCAWCDGAGTADSAPSCLPISDSTCPNFSDTSSDCLSCSKYQTCADCSAGSTAAMSCDWNLDSKVCEDGYSDWQLELVAAAKVEQGIPEAPPLVCPSTCSSRSTCDTCTTTNISDPDANDECAWCESSQSCFDFSLFTLSFTFGQCRSWAIQSETCTTCSENLDCDSCSEHPECGWCHDPTKGDVGRCTDGDVGTYKTDPLETGAACGTFPPACAGPERNTSNCDVLGESSADVEGLWTYEICPDVDECAKGLDTCSQNSTCVNLNPGSYECNCVDGYIPEFVFGEQPGTKGNPCTPECCERATCARPFECVCNPGWTGTNCTVDCGCNQHGDCPENFSASGDVDGSGDVQCGECHHNTIGTTCGECAPGYFGNATDGGECKPCDCNDHGDPSVGQCDPVTGVCTCLDYTDGDHCDSCKQFTTLGARTEYMWDSTHKICYVPCKFLSVKPDKAGFLHGWSYRQKLTEPNAGIYSGVLFEEQTVDSQCSWFIEAPSKEYTITFEFDDIGTECHYDHVHIFDHDDPSLRSQLGAFAGEHAHKPPVISTTGKMLITLMSDGNYILNNKDAVTGRYTIRSKKCPNSCSEHGVCDDVSGVCKCDDGYSGDGCQVQDCPDNCTANDGPCDLGTGLSLCSMCASGAVSCNVTKPVDGESKPLDVWYDVQLPEQNAQLFGARTGHSAVYHTSDDTMWVFGGTTISEMFGDVLRFEFALDGGWTRVSDESTGGDGKPAARYLHAGVLHNSKMLVFGGSTGVSKYLNDLWSFDLSSNSWSKLDGGTLDAQPAWMSSTGTADRPPPIMGHTATIVNDVLLVFGGLCSDGLYGGLHKYTIAPTPGWKYLPAIESKSITPDAVWGHSAVYDKNTNHIVYFGGRRKMRGHTNIGYDLQMSRSSNTQSYSVSENKWYTLAPKLTCPPTMKNCLARSSHSAVLVDIDVYATDGSRSYKTLMFIFGGCPFHHGTSSQFGDGKNTVCYTDETLVLDLTCGATLGWIAVGSSISAMLPGGGPPGRIQHSAIYREKTRSIVILGGYDGTALADMHVYALPAQWSGTFCDRHATGAQCQNDVMCDWNATTAQCEDSITLGKDPNCQQHTAQSYCENDFRCDWTHASTVATTTREIARNRNRYAREANEEAAPSGTCSPKSLPAKTVCAPPPKVIAIDDESDSTATDSADYMCSAEVWGMCKKETHETCNETANVCQSCIVNPSCNACSGIWGIDGEQCSGDEVECRQWGGLPLDDLADVGGVHVCSSSCSSKKSCGECNADVNCAWENKGKFCEPRGLDLSDEDLTCSQRCSELTNATSCQKMQCDWCESLQLCHSSAAGTTELGLGQCHVWPGPAVRTNVECAKRVDCTSCIQTPRCGWCAAPGGLGEGICELGDSSGPERFPSDLVGYNRSSCSAPENEAVFRANAEWPEEEAETDDGHTWSFWNCPDENECAKKERMHLFYKCSGNQTCTSALEPYDKCGTNTSCINTNNQIAGNDRGYECTCDVEGWRLKDDGLNCEPTCDLYGCVHGTCVSKDVCECSLGWTGINCTLDCGCNGHSTCSNGVGVCDKCEEFTTGDLCGDCVEGSHGNGTAGSYPYDGECHPCIDVCNGNSHECRPYDPSVDFTGRVAFPVHENETSGLPVCTGCQNNTHGSYCDICNDGYFVDPDIQMLGFDACTAESNTKYTDCTAKLVRQDMTVNAVCIPCQCNGHSGTCNPLNGEDCKCLNNTQTTDEDCKSLHNQRGSCYAQQCTSCEATVPLGVGLQDVILMGDPSNNSFCYMDTPHDTLIKQTISPGEIHAYQIDPIYTNLNIRLIFDTSRDRGLKYHLATDAGAGQHNGQFVWRNLAPEARVVNTSAAWNHRYKEVVEYEKYDFQTTKLYLLVEGFEGVPALGAEPLNTSEFEYRFFYTQPKMKLDLVIFFTVFFSAFYMLIFVFMPWIYIKASLEARNAEQAEQQQMEVMATRPMASVRLLLSNMVATEQQASRISDMHASRAIVSTPIACQPIGEEGQKDGRHAMVASYLVELPAHPNYRNMCIGAALAIVSPSDVTGPERNEPKGNVAQTAL